MLTLPDTTLAWIILKARELEVKEVEPSESDDYSEDEAFSAVETAVEDGVEGELRNWISDLTYTMQAELVALFWLGRGDASAEEFEDLVQTARESRTTPTEDYLLGQPLFSEMLEEGLEKLGVSVAELESLV